MKKNKRLLVMAGGTGGHVFPGLAIAQRLQQEGWDIRWLGTADRMEAELVPKYGIDIDFIKIKGLKGKGGLRLLMAPIQITYAIIQAIGHMKRWRPDAVLGMGGYVSGPGGVAAKLLNIPIILHEQNAVAGLTNKLLAKIATKVFQAFPNAFANVEVVGNPVRDVFSQIPSPTERLTTRSKPYKILIMGGSQGAKILNDTLPSVMQKLGDDYQVWHQTGAGHCAKVSANYAQNSQKDNYDVVEFIDDVSKAYQWADLVICRSGALTVSEISAVGVAAIFIPFMHKDRQQAYNADYLVKANAAIMIEQPELTPERLVDEIRLLDHNTLINMAVNARALARFDTVDIVAHSIKEITAPKH